MPDYAVGYGKPPIHGRFKPGLSGNPTGRKRPTKTPGALIEALLQEKIAVTEGGLTKKITKIEVIMRQVINKAANGDPRLIRLLLDILAGHTPDTDAGGLGQSDTQLITDMLAEFDRRQTGDPK